MGRVILVVHVDNILVSGAENDFLKMENILNDKIPTNNLGEMKWYMGVAVDRDWDLSVTQTTFSDPLLERF